MHCVDLVKGFQTHIYLKNLASIQPRTSSPKFGRSPRLRSRLHNPPLAPRSSTGSTTVSYSSTATSTRSRSPPCGRTALNSKRCRFLQYLAKKNGVDFGRGFRMLAKRCWLSFEICYYSPRLSRTVCVGIAKETRYCRKRIFKSGREGDREALDFGSFLS